MSVLQVINTVITVLYYGIAAFFLFALAKVFVKSQKAQDAILYSLIMMPFILRLLRLK